MTQTTNIESMPEHGASGDATTPPRPAGSRLVNVDALRGLALAGILLVNIGYFASAYKGTGIPDPAFARPVDSTVAYLVDLVVETKFYLLFSFLFGYSLTLQITSAQRRGAAFAPRFVRRLAGLFAIGLLHALLLFHGDILMLYATLGLALLALHRVPSRVAAVLAGALVVGGVHYYGVWGALAWHWDTPDGVDADAVQAYAATAQAAYRSGLADILAQRWADYQEMLSVLLEFQAPIVLAMFLVGMVAGRARFLADPARHRRTLWTVVVGGLFVGVPGAALYAFANARYVDTALEYFAISYSYLASPALAAAYGAGAILIFDAAPAVARFLAPPGRMALSNYLGQSVFAAFVFTGYGLGLVGRVSPLAAVGTGLALFAVQVFFSAWWLRRHPYGPVEWALRAVSYAEIPPWRRSGAAYGRGGAHRA
ncbi:hypothetical protein GCM10010124_36360 [Pilimelia terevasa]|uniref:DUF418 domain-containing protein n=1 Tax=Pilimelia terevasa TaxID=53372 RepID=A0A8J3BQ86_9ACTN|nr:DUF418 domain-containing protein [Pilimelia terevasa]GGK40356.1 hypothetical protein GCM10010124_36360 [Pilimelia terevasa]